MYRMSISDNVRNRVSKFGILGESPNKVLERILTIIDIESGETRYAEINEKCYYVMKGDTQEELLEKMRKLLEKIDSENK